MTGRRPHAQPDLDRSAFAETVRTLSGLTGRYVPVELDVKATTPRAYFDGRTRRILVGPRLLNESSLVQQGTAAHEFAHALEGPRREPPRPLIIGGFVLSGCAAVGLAVLLGTGVFLVPTCVAFSLPWFWLINVPQRKRETQADVTAVQLVGTEPVAAALATVQRWEIAAGRLSRWGHSLWRGLGASTHPAPRKRLANVTAHTPAPGTQTYI